MITKKYLGSFVVFHRYTSRELRKIIHIELENRSTLFTRWLSNIIATLFIVGSFCFTIASFFALFISQEFVLKSVPLIYFIGSIFFTLASYLQYLQVINADVTNIEHTSLKRRKWIWFAYRKNNLGFLSSSIQLIGTVLFNINTYDGMLTYTSYIREEFLISIPNMIGSICFLLASFFAWLEVYYDKKMRTFVSVLWWIIWLNILGSVFFQISALYGFSFSAHDSETQRLSIYFTMFGGFAFFLASYLLIPEAKKVQ